MAESGQKAEKQLREITKCSICMSVFTDPRVLPCIHTFCFECLKSTSEAAQKRPGDKIPCPLCRKEFLIPEDGTNGVQKNFFMENLLDFKSALQFGSVTIICDICSAGNDCKEGQIPNATMRCIECQDYYCDNCVKVHKLQKLSKYHQMVKIGSDMKSETTRLVSVKSCTKHIQKTLDYYCTDCKKIVCVSCFVESHKLHDCKDVTTVDEEFRKTIEQKAKKISTYTNDMMLMRNTSESGKSDFLTEIVEKEKEILKVNEELKAIIDQHTQSLLDELSVIKSNHLKELETRMEEIDRYCPIFSSFHSYCTELTLKGSASDICSSVDELIARADDLERDHEAFIYRPYNSVEMSFYATDLLDVLQNANNNLVGEVEAKTETASQCLNVAIVVGLNDDDHDDENPAITEHVFQINLHQPNDITELEEIPATVAKEAVAAVYDNTMYVAGVGHKHDEIWKCNQTSGWIKCASLVQSRRTHSAAFIDEVLYICGGFVDSSELTLDSVEAFNAVINTCTTVGKLILSVQMSGNCVPFRNSLYIFGGVDKGNKNVNHVQVYNTKENTCTLIQKPMPRPFCLMRAVLWKTSVVLLGYNTCLIFNIKTEMWQERKQYKTDVANFGLVLENGRLFVIGGGVLVKDKDGNIERKYSDDVRYVPLLNIIDDRPIEWKIHGKLPKPSVIYAYANIRCFV